METLDRLLAKVDKTETCWLWKGCKTNTGYGMIRIAGKTKLVHRISYELHVGKIPTGLHILHRCDTPLCCNPGHLYPGTDADNTADRLSRGRGATGSRCHARKPIYGEAAHNSRLKEVDVIYIREQAALGVSAGDLGTMFGIHSATISCIVRGKKWKAAGGPVRERVLSRSEVGFRSAKKRWGFVPEEKDGST